MPFGRPFGETQELTALFQRESREKPQLHHFRQAAVGLGQPGERLVQCEQFGPFVSFLHRDVRRKFEPHAASAVLGRQLAPRVFDQDAPHGLRRCREEVSTTIPLSSIAVAYQPDIGLVNQRRRLERMIGRLLRHPLGS